jgi:hypothetical protein
LGTELIDNVEDATVRRNALVDEERQNLLWPQGDDKSKCKIRVMSANDIQALCLSLGDRERFQTLRNDISRFSAIEAARIFQYVCAQLRVGNCYVNDAILTHLHRVDDCLELWTKDEVVRKSIEKLDSLGVVRVFHLTNEEKTRCLALPLAWETETQLYRWFRSKLDDDGDDGDAKLHPFTDVMMNNPTNRLDWESKCKNVYKLYPAQVKAVETIFTKKITIISGPPGTGKTFTLSRAFAALRESKVQFTWQVATPTCKSTKQLESELRRVGTHVEKDQVTTAQFLIARAAGFLADMRKEYAEKLRNIGPDDPLPEAPTIDNVRVHVTVLAIDEASMWSSMLLKQLLTVFSCDVFICTGDLDQCTPMSWGRPFHVLNAFEREYGSAAAGGSGSHLCVLDQVCRNSGKLSDFGQNIRLNRLDPLVKCNPDGSSEIVTTARTHEDLCRLLSQRNGVIGVDDRLVVSAAAARSNYMICIEKINTEMHRTAGIGPVGSPPIHVVTYNTSEMTSANMYCQAYRRHARVWKHCMLKGNFPDEHFGEHFVPSEQPRGSIIPPKEVQTVRRDWSLAVGDYVYCSKTMKKLHKALVETGKTAGLKGIPTTFFQHWSDRFAGINAPSWNDMNRKSVVDIADANLSNGETGLIVQMYVLDLNFRCPCKGVKFDEACIDCEKNAYGAPVMCGKTWAIRALKGHINRTNLKAWGIGGDTNSFLMAVLWLESVDKFIHIPIPIYPPTALEPGYALTFFRCQGSQWNTVVFVCSNGQRARGDSSKNAYQKMQERQHHRAKIGEFHTDSYWQNRRTAYVACTRARQNLVILTSMPWNEKLLQLMEHSAMPPNILEDFFGNRLQVPPMTDVPSILSYMMMKKKKETPSPSERKKRQYDDDDDDEAAAAGSSFQSKRTVAPALHDDGDICDDDLMNIDC